MSKDSKRQQRKKAEREYMIQLRKLGGKKPRSQMTEDELEDDRNERNRRKNRRAKLAKKLKASRKK
mgnify:FL=1